MNLIDYQPFQFDDSAIVSGRVSMENSLMFDSLKPDELSVEVICDISTEKRKLLTVDLDWYTTVDGRGYVVGSDDIRKFTYGDPVLYYYDGVLQGKYYIRSVDRLSIDHFRLNAVSLVGLLASVQHLGGIYTGETAGSVIESLMWGYRYTIENDVASVPVYGHLPIASVRDNLQQVLFAIGASLVKNADGNPHFKFLKDTTPIAVGSERIYIGGKLNYTTPATEVIVTEHSYYKSRFDKEVSLFDNTDGSGAASRKLVTFAEPCHSLSTTGTLTIDNDGRDFGANYAYVSGTGTLTGYQYTHTTKVFSVPTGKFGETNEANIERATLVSAANSANVAARVSAFKGSSEEVACGIVLSDDDIKPTSMVSFNDPYGEATQGMVSTMEITMSGKSKADCTIVKNYIPGNFGNNYNNVAIITSNQTWTPPEGVKLIRLVLGQGGQAGQNGFNGENGYTPEWSYDPAAKGGAGGKGGKGGNSGKVSVVDVKNPGTVTLRIGAGGSPSVGSGAIGGEGGETEAIVNGQIYTSASGAIPQEGYLDIFDGQLYSVIGEDGIDGAEGGTNGKGGDVTYDGQTWYGGTWGAKYESSGSKTRYAYGGRGGGAAYGANGGDGGDYYWHDTGTGGYYVGGRGGDGGDAQTTPYTPKLGSGGIGGNGGGGGGTGGYYYYEQPIPSAPDYNAEGYGSNGVGGDGSNGGNGGGGYALIYY